MEVYVRIRNWVERALTKIQIWVYLGFLEQSQNWHDSGCWADGDRMRATVYCAESWMRATMYCAISGMRATMYWNSKLRGYSTMEPTATQT